MKTQYGREETCEIMVSVCLFNPRYMQPACTVCTLVTTYSVYYVH